MELLLHPTYFPNVISLRCLQEGGVVWEVWDNFQKQTYRNRCYICTDRGQQMLTIPIRHNGGAIGRQRYRDVQIDNTYPWQRQHWRSLETAYRAAPYFEYYEAPLKAIFQQEFKTLLALNLSTARLLCEMLDIEFPEATSTTYEAEPEGKRDLRILANAKTMPETDFPSYPQVFDDRHPFVPNLSGLDLLFNEGKRAGEYINKLFLPGLS